MDFKGFPQIEQILEFLDIDLFDEITQVGDKLHKPFLFKPTKGKHDWRSAHVKLLGEIAIDELLPGPIFCWKIMFLI